MYRLSWDSHSKKSAPAVVPDFDKKLEKVIVNADARGKSCRPKRPPLIVIIHCFYLDCLPLIGKYLSRVNDYDLLINLVCSTSIEEVQRWTDSLLPNMYGAKRVITIRTVENLGRDVKEFWNPALELESKYPFFLKIHTKQSVHSKRINPLTSSHGSLWLSDILESLIPDNDQCGLILDILQQGEIGAVFPFPWRQLRYAGWSCKANLFHAQKLMDLLQIPRSCLLFPLQYPIGNMFWGSTKLLKRWGNEIYYNCQWPREPIPPDGTLLHAIERSIGFLYNMIGLRVAYSKSVGGKSMILCWTSCQPKRTALSAHNNCSGDMEVLPKDEFLLDVFSLANDEYGVLSCMQKFSLPKNIAFLCMSYFIQLLRRLLGWFRRLL